MDAVEETDGGAAQNEISLGWLLLKRFGDVCGWAEFFGERVGDIGERVAGTAGNDEFAFLEKRLGLMPLGDVAEGVDADQKEELVAFLESLLKTANGVDGIVRSRSGGGR